MHHLWVAIDGPAASGKSTVAAAVAEELSISYLDTGAMYRAIAWLCFSHRDDVSFRECIRCSLSRVRFSLCKRELLLDGAPLDPAIRALEVAKVASDIARWSFVRRSLVDVQRSIAAEHSLVMDGRDIGTVVLPQAQVKVFLTASLDERVRRRQEELIRRGLDADYKKIEKLLSDRDRCDTLRPIAPLCAAPGARVLDTTDRTVEDIVGEIVLMCVGVRSRK